MKTLCHAQLSFANLESTTVVAAFDGGKITSNGGALLLREIDHRIGLVDRMDQAIVDPRMAGKLVHAPADLLRQRMFGVALGYEDVKDHATLRSDPTLKTAADRLPDSGDDLASQPTLCRLENRVTRSQLRRLGTALVDLYREAHPGDRRLIVLDIDATDDPTHGRQQLSLFHGYFDPHVYHPLLVFDGLTGHPLTAVLRPGNSHAAKGAVGILNRLIRRLQRAYPQATILVRADTGFASPAIDRLLEYARVKYTIGLVTNERLRGHVADRVTAAHTAFDQTGLKQRAFTSFRYRADSWHRSRRVVAKVEYLPQGPNTRFVVTNLVFATPPQIYDDIYVGRGEAENRIKELKNHLHADRTSCHAFRANQLRLLLHTFALVLLWHLRQAVAGTELAVATFETPRLKLLKVGARVRESVRRVAFSLASSYPDQPLFAAMLTHIQAMPLRH